MPSRALGQVLKVVPFRVLNPTPQQGGLLRREGPDGATLPSPAEVADELNRRFPLIELSGHYFTFLYGILDLTRRRLEYVRAGHPAPLVLSAEGARACQALGDVFDGFGIDETLFAHALTVVCSALRISSEALA